MLIAFDFDGTLSDSEMTVLLGEEAGVSGEIAGITERAMNDEIGYAESLRERAALLEGLEDHRVDQAFDRVVLRDGAADIIRDLRRHDHHVAILTGGFDRGVERALEKEDVDVDTIIANRLPMANGALTGEVDGPLIEGTKEEALDRLAGENGFTMAETIAVGDGANDLPMIQVAETGVGYEPKPVVEREADVVVDSMRKLRELFEQHEYI